jgi:hypothetical protein
MQRSPAEDRSAVDYAQGAPPSAPVLTLDLAQEAEVVRGEMARRGVAHSAVTLAKHDDLRVVLITLEAGAVVKKHTIEALEASTVLLSLGEPTPGPKTPPHAPV